MEKKHTYVAPVQGEMGGKNNRFITLMFQGFWGGGKQFCQIISQLQEKKRSCYGISACCLVTRSSVPFHPESILR